MKSRIQLGHSQRLCWPGKWREVGTPEVHFASLIDRPWGKTGDERWQRKEL